MVDVHLHMGLSYFCFAGKGPFKNDVTRGGEEKFLKMQKNVTTCDNQKIHIRAAPAAG